LSAQTLQHLSNIAILVGLLLTGLGGYGSYRYGLIVSREEKSKTPVYAGIIEPGKEKAPPLPSGIRRDAVSLLLGDNLRIVSAKYPTHIIAKNGKPFLTLRQKDGRLLITATLVDASGRLVVRIINNEFQASAENSFNPRQPDEHSLLIRDSSGKEVLNLRYLNPKALRITGQFAIEGFTEPVIIDANDGLTWPGGGGLAALTVDATQSDAGIIDLGTGRLF
jgi:hypothetical protein